MHFAALLLSILIFQELGEFCVRCSAQQSIIKCSVGSGFQLVRNI